MKFTQLTAAAVCVLALGACTHLEVGKTTGDNPSKAGYAYMLDYTQYELVLTRTLLACKVGAEPSIKIEATATPGLVPDGEHVYVIDPSSLISAFKTSDISVDYKDGRLVGFNSATVDRTGEVVTSVAATAGKIALLATGTPVGFVDGSKTTQLCTADAVAKLQLVKDETPKLAEMANSLLAARTELTGMTTQYAVRPDGKLRKEIAKKTDAIKAAQDAVDAQNKKVSEATKWLTDTVTITWPETSRDFHTALIQPLRPATVDRWFNLAAAYSFHADRSLSYEKDSADVTRLRNGGPTGNAAKIRMSEDQFKATYPALTSPTFEPLACDTTRSAACDELVQLWKALGDTRLDGKVRKSTEASVSLHLVRRGTYGGEGASTDNGNPKDGLRYRMPAAGALVICEQEAVCAKGDKTLVAQFPGPIAQLGMIFNVPFSSPAFANGNIGLTLDDQGRLLKASLKRDNAAALGMANAADSVVDQVVAYDKARDSAELTELRNRKIIADARKGANDSEAALTKTPKQLLEEQISLIETQQKLATVTAGLSVSEQKEDLNSQIAIAKLEVDLAEQRKKLLDDPNAAQADVKKRYDAEAAVTTAEKALLEAELARLKAQRELDKARSGS